MNTPNHPDAAGSSLPPSRAAIGRTTRRDFVVQTAGALTAVALLPDLGLARGFRPAEPFSVGLIGCGRQGRLIIGELGKIENVKLAGVCDTDQARRENAARLAAGAEAFESHTSMLERLKGVSAVIIATPTHLHKQIALDCIAAGKHVYCESPLAHTVEDCRAIAVAAGAAKTVFAVGMEGRSNPVYKLARTFFRSDAVRDFVGAEVQTFQKTSWRFGGSGSITDAAANWRLDPELSTGLVGELGVQQIDVTTWYVNQLPTSVSGRGAIRRWDDGRTLPDTVHAEFGFVNKTSLSLNASLANSYGGRFELLRGTNAAIKLAWSHGWMFKESDAPTQGWEVYANRQQFHKDEGITLIADATKLAERGKLQDGVGLPNAPLWYALSDFIRSAVEGQPAVCSAADGARSSILAILGNRAVIESGSIAIDPAQLQF